MVQFYDYNLEDDLKNVFNKINKPENQKLCKKAFNIQSDDKILLHRPSVTSENIANVGIAFFGLNSYSDELSKFSEDTNFTVEVQEYYGKLKCVISKYEEQLNYVGQSYYSNFFKIVLPENSFKYETGLEGIESEIIKLFTDAMVDEINFLRSKYSCQYFIFFGNKCWDLTYDVRKKIINENTNLLTKNEVLIKIIDKDSKYYFVWEKHFSRFSHEASEKVLEWMKGMQ